jgi:hypothetical protein
MSLPGLLDIIPCFLKHRLQAVVQFVTYAMKGGTELILT